MPAIVRTSVDLPAPLAPTIAEHGAVRDLERDVLDRLDLAHDALARGRGAVTVLRSVGRRSNVVL